MIFATAVAVLLFGTLLRLNTAITVTAAALITAAIHHEKQIKRWNRAWKIVLIEAENSGWNDLYEQLGA
jgi:predicted GIY-YIG superfamily endonuclease